MLLTYRPGVKRWLSRQTESCLPFANMGACYAIVGFIVSLLQNPILSQTQSATILPPTPSSWMSFCFTTEILLLPCCSLCLALVSFILRNGTVEPLLSRHASVHFALLASPLGLLLSLIGSSLSSSLYGVLASVLTLTVMWDHLPFSQ